MKGTKHTCHSTEMPTATTDKRLTTTRHTSTSSMGNGTRSSGDSSNMGCTIRRINTIMRFKGRTTGMAPACLLKTRANSTTTNACPRRTTISSTCKWGHKGADGLEAGMAVRVA